MDESESQLSIALAQQAVFAIERPAKTGDAVDKILAPFAIVMEMDLYIRYCLANHFRERLDQRRVVFFFRKKERILRRVTSGIPLTPPCYRRPGGPPRGDARLRGF